MAFVAADFLHIYYYPAIGCQHVYFIRGQGQLDRLYLTILAWRSSGTLTPETPFYLPYIRYLRGSDQYIKIKVPGI